MNIARLDVPILIPAYRPAAPLVSLVEALLAGARAGSSLSTMAAVLTSRSCSKGSHSGTEFTYCITP